VREREHFQRHRVALGRCLAPITAGQPCAELRACIGRQCLPWKWRHREVILPVVDCEFHRRCAPPRLTLMAAGAVDSGRGLASSDQPQTTRASLR
jgi:hypothetical protein